MFLKSSVAETQKTLYGPFLLLPLVTTASSFMLVSPESLPGLDAP